jgi:hypothetical protein
MTHNENGGITLDETRSALLNGYVRKTKLITTDDGISIELREPTVGQRGRVFSEGGMSASEADIKDIAGMQIAAIIECAYHPGTGKPIFNYVDKEAIESLPTQSWFDLVATEAMNMMSGEPTVEGKPSSTTVSDKPFSTSQANSEKQLAS